MRSVKKIEERTKRIVSMATICVRPLGFQFHGRRPKGTWGEAIAKKKGVYAAADRDRRTTLDRCRITPPARESRVDLVLQFQVGRLGAREREAYTDPNSPSLVPSMY